jgi:hypothetical protein
MAMVMSMFFELTRNISRGKMFVRMDGAMLSLSRHTTLASGPRILSPERAREVNNMSVVKVGDVGVVCSEDAFAAHMKAGRLGEFCQPCTTPPGVRDPRSV